MSDGSRPEAPAGRVPPSDLDAEAAVLSAILLTPSALDQIPFLESKHFYADSNRRIYQAAIELRDQGQPIDIVTVAGYLRDRERLQQVGGSPYLAQLSDATPAVAHIESHARTVLAKWEVRQIIFAAQQIAIEGYGDIGDPEEWKQLVDQRVFSVTRSIARDQNISILGDATRDAIEVMKERQQTRGLVMTGVTTGLPTLDARLGGLEPGRVYVFAARPGLGKTGCATGIALACATPPHPADPDSIGSGVVFVSVEMPRRLIAFRVLSQVSQVDSMKIMRGKLTSAEWGRIEEAQQLIRRMPIAIEDSSSHTSSSIRSAYRMGSRRIQERFGKHVQVKLCAVDYLQLINSATQTNNREQEISEVSRTTKSMAKDEGIAMLSLAQVNRECEKRTPKIPELRDLRECLHGQSLVLNADTGERVPIATIARENLRFRVWALDEKLKLVRRPIEAAWLVGKKKVVKVTTVSGRTIRCTTGHRFLTIDGWLELREIKPGKEIAVPRAYTATAKSVVISEDRALLLGWMIGNAWFGGSPTVTTTTLADAKILAALAKREFPVRPRILPEHLSKTAQKVVLSMGHMCGAKKNPLTRWLRDIGVWGHRASTKSVPELMFLQDEARVAALLRGLFHADGTLTKKAGVSSIVVKFNTVSEVLARQVQHLLLRVGIAAHLRHDVHGRGRIKSRFKRIWCVYMTDREQVTRFVTRVGFLGDKQRLALSKIEKKTNDAGKADRLPLEVGSYVDGLRKNLELRVSDLSWVNQKKRMSRSTAARLGMELRDPRLKQLGVSDVVWDKVLTVEQATPARVYDLTVAENHNFVVDDFITHNSGSIESDADVVAFLYREDYYRPKGDKKDNKAEIHLAKWRDGFTGIIRCEFDPRSARFFEKSSKPDYEQLGDMFDDYLPGQYGENRSNIPETRDWHEDYDK